MRYVECGLVVAQSQFELGLVTSAAGNFSLQTRLTVNLCEVASVVRALVLYTAEGFRSRTEHY